MTIASPPAFLISAAASSQAGALRRDTTTLAPCEREMHGDRLADALARAGDDGDLAGEVEKRRCHVVSSRDEPGRHNTLCRPALDARPSARQRSMPPGRLATSAEAGLLQDRRGLRRAAAGAAHRDDRLVLAAAPARASASSPSGTSVAPRIWPSGPVNSSGSRTSSTCTLARFSSSQCGSISQTPAKVKRSGAQVGIVRRARVVVAGLAAAQIGRHRLVDLLGMRQVEVLHVADVVALADLAAEPRIELLLLGDAGRRSGRDSRAPDRAGRSRAARRCARAPSGRARARRPAGSRCGREPRIMHAVAGEGHALVVEHVGHAAVGVAGRRAHLERAAAEARRDRRPSAGGRRPRRRSPRRARSGCRAAASAARRRSRGRHGRASPASTRA